MTTHTKHAHHMDLYEAVALRADCGAAAKDIRALVKMLADWMAKELKAGNEVSLPGMFKLRVKSSAARTGRNPKTGEKITIAAHKRVTLTVDRAWRRDVFETVPVKSGDKGQWVPDHAHRKAGRIVPATEEKPRGVGPFVKRIAPAFPDMTQKALTQVLVALREEVAERVLVAGHCTLTDIASLKFRGKAPKPARQVRNPRTKEMQDVPADPACGGCRGAAAKHLKDAVG